MEGKSGHPPRRNGPRRGQGARTSATRRFPASQIRIWAASTITRTPASAASRSTFGTPRAWRSRRVSSPFPTLSRRVSPPACSSRLGLGYEIQRKIRPDIIYVQQSGMGGYGSYGRLRTVGPIAAARSPERIICSGLPEPAMPAGWGYSYLDWMGAYGFAQALLGALYYRSVTGKGQRIDASQCEAGIFLARSLFSNGRSTGANGREPAIARPMAARRRTGLIVAGAVTAGSRSPVLMTTSGLRWSGSPAPDFGARAPASPASRRRVRRPGRSRHLRREVDPESRRL